MFQIFHIPLEEIIQLIIIIKRLICYIFKCDWDRPWNSTTISKTKNWGPIMLQTFLNRTAGMISNVTNRSVVFMSSYVFVLCAGLLLGHRHQPKGGCLAHTAKEEAEVWRAGEIANRNCKFPKKHIFLHMVFFCYSFCLCLLGFSILLCLCLWLCTSTSVSFPFALLSLPLYSYHMQTHTQAQ